MKNVDFSRRSNKFTGYTLLNTKSKNIKQNLE